MKPLKNYLLVGQKAKEEKTAGGIILGGADIETGSKPAVVLAIGPDVTQVKIGDQLVVKWSEGLPVTVQGEPRVIISEEFVYGIY
jgi:co-chaperonin GroES (HSP10)